MKQTLFIINPQSACGATLRIWPDARRELIERGFNFTERFTSRAGEATEITRRALIEGISKVVAVGGDGTLNEVINGYLDDAGRPINPAATVGLLPSGTGSDFRRSLGIEKTSVLRALAGSNSKTIDAVRVRFVAQDGIESSRYSINVVTFGLGGEAAALVNQWRERLPRWIGGRARFIAAAVRALARYRLAPVTIRLDDEREVKISSNLIVVANGRFAGGGMMLAPNAKLDDGLLDVILTDGANRLDVIKELPRIQRGAHLKNPKVTEARAREVSIISTEPLAIDIDGEASGRTPAQLSVLPCAVRLAIEDESG